MMKNAIVCKVLIAVCLILLHLQACDQTPSSGMKKSGAEPLVRHGEYIDVLDSSDGGEEQHGEYIDVLDSSGGGELRRLVDPRLIEQQDRQPFDIETLRRLESGLLAVDNTAGFLALTIDDHDLREAYSASLIDVEIHSQHLILLVYNAKTTYDRFHVLIDGASGNVVYVRPQWLSG